MPEYMSENLQAKHQPDGEIHPGETVEEKSRCPSASACGCRSIPSSRTTTGHRLPLAARAGLPGTAHRALAHRGPAMDAGARLALGTRRLPIRPRLGCPSCLKNRRCRRRPDPAPGRQAAGGSVPKASPGRAGGNCPAASWSPARPCCRRWRANCKKKSASASRNRAPGSPMCTSIPTPRYGWRSATSPAGKASRAAWRTSAGMGRPGARGRGRRPPARHAAAAALVAAADPLRHQLHRLARPAGFPGPAGRGAGAWREAGAAARAAMARRPRRRLAA